MTAPALQALGALGDPSRRAIFEHLTTREATVTDIADRLPITRSAVSQHLRVLKEAGLVTDHAEGRNRIYRIDPRGIGAMRAWLDTQWKDSLDAFRAFADRAASDGETPE